jgi:hypothetical protein
MALLVRFDFTSAPMRLWRGYGLLETKDGHAWSALGTLGSVSGLEQAVNGQAPEATFTLSGVDQGILQKTREEFDAEVRGRIVTGFVQFFGVDDDDDPGNQRPLDNPYPVWAGTCLKPKFAIDRGSGLNTASVTAESIYSLRSRPRAGTYTDRDQQHRFNGDLGFGFIGALINKVIAWPDY